MPYQLLLFILILGAVQATEVKFKSVNAVSVRKEPGAPESLKGRVERSSLYVALTGRLLETAPDTVQRSVVPNAVL